MHELRLLYTTAALEAALASTRLPGQICWDQRAAAHRFPSLLETSADQQTPLCTGIAIGRLHHALSGYRRPWRKDCSYSLPAGHAASCHAKYRVDLILRLAEANRKKLAAGNERRPATDGQ